MSMAQMSLDGDGIEAGVDGNNKQNGINKEVDRIFKKEHKSTKVGEGGGGKRSWGRGMERKLIIKRWRH